MEDAGVGVVLQPPLAETRRPAPAQRDPRPCSECPRVVLCTWGGVCPSRAAVAPPFLSWQGKEGQGSATWESRIRS